MSTDNLGLKAFSKNWREFLRKYGKNWDAGQKAGLPDSMLQCYDIDRLNSGWTYMKDTLIRLQKASTRIEKELAKKKLSKIKPKVKKR